MSAIRKQLQWDDTIDVWPITDTSAVHYKYNPSDSSKILSPVQGTSYGLDHFLNGLVNRMLTTDDIIGAATNVNKGKGILYNTGDSITNVALPDAGVSNAFVRCTYTTAGALSLAFTTTTYAGSSSDGGAASAAVKLNGGGAGQIVYQSGTNVTAFLAAGTDGQALTYDATNNKPKWTSITSNISTALFVGASNGTTTTAQSTNGNVHLILQEGSAYTRYCIEGAGRIAVTSNNVGKITITSTDPPNFAVATAEVAGTAGLVPAPAANQLGSLGYYLRADGTWVIPPNDKVTQTATTTNAAYELLFSESANNTTTTEGARKTSTLTYNPSTKALTTGGAVNGLTLSQQTTGFKISGGTTSKTLTVGADYTLGAACAKGIYDKSSATAAGSSGTNLVTERALYYALPTINGAHTYNSSTTLFAPTSVGTSGQILQSNGSGAPSWVSTENYETVTLSTSEAYSLSSSSWSAVSTALSTTSGTYALYIDDNTNGSYSGVFAIEGGASEKLEEIPLHWATAATTTADTTRIYAAIKEGKLQLASNDSAATSYTLTIKYKRII